MFARRIFDTKTTSASKIKGFLAMSTAVCWKDLRDKGNFYCTCRIPGFLKMSTAVLQLGSSRQITYTCRIPGFFEKSTAVFARRIFKKTQLLLVESQALWKSLQLCLLEESLRQRQLLLVES